MGTVTKRENSTVAVYLLEVMLLYNFQLLKRFPCP